MGPALLPDAGAVRGAQDWRRGADPPAAAHRVDPGCDRHRPAGGRLRRAARLLPVRLGHRQGVCRRGLGREDGLPAGEPVVG